MPMNFPRKILACLLCCAFLTSCGGSFVYDRLDWLIPWYLDSYVDLSREQRQSLREQLSPLLQQHRKEELGRYLQVLDGIEAELQAPLKPAQVEAWIGELGEAAGRIEQTMLQAAVEFGASISDAQMQEFLDNLYSRQEELEEELLARSDEEYAKEHTGHLKDLLQRVIGRLDRSQEQRLAQAASAMQRYDSVWLEDRRLWLDQLQVLLQRKPGWQVAVLEAYGDREKARSETYREIVAHNKSVVAAALADVLNNRSEKQESNTTSEFADLRSMLQKLMEKPQDQAGSS
ncbi:MAG TPA: DUF6279 family lipoprotein [Xanthomonadales bacterium]|nr:DUF6279 family lipoprotein [Xanthomonadales bacterium]